MSFPSTLDTITTTPSGSDSLSTGSHTDIHTELKTLVELIQAKVGTDGSAVTSSIDYIIKNTSNGHDHDGVDSKQISVANLSVSGLTANQVVGVNSAGTGLETKGIGINSTLTASEILRTNAAGTLIESSGKVVPSGIIVGDTDTQTLTNKVLTSPTLNAPVVNDWNQWVGVSEVWTYDTANTVLVSGDVTANYEIGDKVKLSDNGSDEFYYITGKVYSAPNTTLTLNAGSDYTLSGGAISNKYMSRGETPLGFPAMFNYLLIWTASVVNPAIGNGTIVSKFRMKGKLCEVFINLLFGGTTTFGTGTYRFTLPVAVTTTIGSNKLSGLMNGMAEDSGAATYPIIGRIESSVTYWTAYTTSGNAAVTQAVPFTFANGDSIFFSGTYLSNL